MTTAKKTTQRQGYKTGESVVYPAHGVGTIIAIEEQEVAGFKLELFVILFEKDFYKQNSGQQNRNQLFHLRRPYQSLSYL